MPSPLRIGVVGLGFGRQVHVPAFRSLKDCVVVGLCGSRLEKTRKAAHELRIPKTYEHWRDMLADPEIDAVSLALPPTLQPLVVRTAAARGKHVFCEKPAALNYLQVQSMVKAVERGHVTHAIDFLFPELETWQKAKAILRKRSLGRLRFVSLTWKVETFAYRKNLMSWKRQCEKGGGTLNNFVSHSLYYMEWLFGRIIKVSARLRPSDASGDARTELWLEFAAGFPATVSVAADAFLGAGHRLDVHGENGTMLLENTSHDYVSGFSLSLGTRGSPALSPIKHEPHDRLTDGRIAAVASVARRFLQAVRDRKVVTPNLYDGLRVQRLIDVIRLANRRGTWVSVKAKGLCQTLTL